MSAPAYLNRAMRRGGYPEKPGYHGRVGGCPHTIATFFAISERSSRLTRATYPCVQPRGHDWPHRTAGGKEWT